MNKAAGFSVVFLLLWANVPTARAQTSDNLLIGPPEAGWGAMFAQPGEWAKTRSHVSGILQADHNLNKVGDDQLRTWFTQMNQWHIKLELEVGAVKGWSATGKGTFAIEAPIWDRFLRLGAPIGSIGMDEPLTASRVELHKPDSYAVDETVDFISLVRHRYPNVMLGDIEPYPSTSKEDHFRWIATIQQRLRDAGVRPLDFYRLDVNWAYFNIGGSGNWHDVKAIEQQCRKLNTRFSLIYWAADYPALKARGLAGDDTWYVGIMAEGQSYAEIGGSPDQFVVESWIHAPSLTVPETDPFTFDGATLRFAERFLR